MTNLKYVPLRQWKTYQVEYSSWYGENTDTITAPNKTIARQFFLGDHNPGCKIISIREIGKEVRCCE